MKSYDESNKNRGYSKKFNAKIN